MNGVMSKYGLSALTDALIPFFTTCGWELCLFKEPWTPSIEPLENEFTEADYPGYSRWTIDYAVSLTSLSLRGAVEFNPPFGQFSGTSLTPVDGLLYGWVVLLPGIAPKRVAMAQPFFFGPTSTPWVGFPFTHQFLFRTLSLTAP